MRFVEPEGPPIPIAGIFRTHEEAKDTPNDGDDGIDDKKLTPSGQPTLATRGACIGGLYRARHHETDSLAGIFSQSMRQIVSTPTNTSVAAWRTSRSTRARKRSQRKGRKKR